MNQQQKHCSTCQCHSQNESIVNSPTNYQDDFFDRWDKIVERDNRICNKCGTKKHKIQMDEFAKDMFICKEQLLCEQRRSQMLAMAKQQV